MLYIPELPDDKNESVTEQLARFRRNINQIYEIDEMTKRQKTLLHRFIFYNSSEDRVFYQVVKVTMFHVTLAFCRETGANLPDYMSEKYVISKKVCRTRIKAQYKLTCL